MLANGCRRFLRYERRIVSLANTEISQQRRHLQHLGNRMRHPGQRLQDFHQRLDDLELRLRGGFRHYLGQFRIPDMQARLLRAIQRQTERARARLNLAAAGVQDPGQMIDAQQRQLNYLQQGLARQMREMLNASKIVGPAAKPIGETPIGETPPPECPTRPNRKNQKS